MQKKSFNGFSLSFICLGAFLVLGNMGCTTSSQRSNAQLADGASRDDFNTDEVSNLPDELEVSGASTERNAQEIAADQLARSTFPLVHNEFVQKWINFFTVSPRGRATFQTWLSRSTRYIPMMKQVLREEGLPEDLIYLSMIESGFNPRAYSKASAVGPWQFIKPTGVRYGLEVSTWVDERRDILKSTKAAAKYLGELHTIFGSWYLAAAGYNAGEGRVLSAIRDSKTRNFWELSRQKGNFRAETRDYVPKIIAAALVAKDPEKYGFKDIPYESPLSWKTVTIGPRRDLRSVADIAGVDYEVVRILNAELRLEVTPPDGNYDVRVPPESHERVAARVNDIRERSVPLYANHKIGRGETLSQIANRYRVRVSEILEANNIRRANSIRAGATLKIPIVKGAATRSIASPQPNSARRGPSSMAPNSWKRVRVRRGDSLWKLSERHNVSMNELRRMNNMSSKSNLQAGSTILVPAN
jgi:membrane-bound lytic murein transglycosylase D